MQSLFCPVVLLVLGGALFTRWQKAKKEQKRTEAIVWALASIVFVVFGLLGLLDAILTLLNL
jgi:hypothetical protein